MQFSSQPASADATISNKFSGGTRYVRLCSLVPAGSFPAMRFRSASSIMTERITRSNLQARKASSMSPGVALAQSYPRETRRACRVLKRPGSTPTLRIRGRMGVYVTRGSLKRPEGHGYSMAEPAQNGTILFLEVVQPAWISLMRFQAVNVCHRLQRFGSPRG